MIMEEYNIQIAIQIGKIEKAIQSMDHWDKFSNEFVDITAYLKEAQYLLIKSLSN